MIVVSVIDNLRANAVVLLRLHPYGPVSLSPCRNLQLLITSCKYGFGKIRMYLPGSQQFSYLSSL